MYHLISCHFEIMQFFTQCKPWSWWIIQKAFIKNSTFSHTLSEFIMATILCQVASIRTVNESPLPHCQTVCRFGHDKDIPQKRRCTNVSPVPTWVYNQPLLQLIPVPELIIWHTITGWHSIITNFQKHISYAHIAIWFIQAIHEMKC